jgi:phosphocarrier protein
MAGSEERDVMKLSGEHLETRDFVLRNRYGMHVRPAGLFAKVASRFNAEVQVEKDGSVVSGKSIMALMTLDAACGATLRVSADGPQAREVLDELQGLIDRKFDIPDEQ